jgi:ABC-2 type transport system permease protein
MAATIGALLFGLLHGWIALLAGAVKGSKGFAAGVAWGVALAGYLLNVMANLSDSLDWLRWASPLYWATANDPIVNGIPFEYLILVGACVVTLVATIVLFDRHDLS